jgi:SpoVK/Ycf46/Vps4 family AAA+-type ATPase
MAAIGLPGRLMIILRYLRALKNQSLAFRGSATLILTLFVGLIFGGLPESAARTQDSALSQTQQSTLKEIILARREKRRSKQAAGIGVLLVGAQEKQQTAAAQMLARELGRDLYRVDLSKIVSKYIGETEKNLRQVFAAAQVSDSILFFDEADALFGKRSEVKDSHDRYANIEINYLLQQIEKYDGIVILSTRRKEAIDPAFLRRLRFVLDFQSSRRT